MIRQIRYLGIASSLIFASVGFAQYTMELTGIADGVVADGAYVSPYQGTIKDNDDNVLYSGYVICDDYDTESFLNQPWSATATNAGSLNGTEKFPGGSAAQNYDAVAWLANQLLLPQNVTSGIAQINYSFAIWDIFDGLTTDPMGGAAGLKAQAFAAVQGGYVGSNVSVYTPSPLGASQEFLVVQTPEPPAAAILGLDLATVLALFFLLRRRWARA